jgi:beta-glucosidase-like glycosyl hydrolase
MKHFVGYPNPRSGHDRSPEWIPDRQLYQYYTPAFYAAIKAGVATAMESVPSPLPRNLALATSPLLLSLLHVRAALPSAVD